MLGTSVSLPAFVCCHIIRLQPGQVVRLYWWESLWMNTGERISSHEARFVKPLCLTMFGSWHGIGNSCYLCAFPLFLLLPFGVW